MRRVEPMPTDDHALDPARIADIRQGVRAEEDHVGDGVVDRQDDLGARCGVSLCSTICGRLVVCPAGARREEGQ